MTPTDPAAVEAMIEMLGAWSPLVASGYEVPAAGQAMDEAAAMLRALVEERDNWRMLESIPHRRLEAAEAEVAALREALREIEAVEIDWRLSTAENMRAASDIARAALKENPDGL